MYKVNNRKAEKGLEHKLIYLFNHFKTHTEFLNNVVINFIDKTDGPDPTRREQSDKNPGQAST